jgi:hypothetical protein
VGEREKMKRRRGRRKKKKNIEEGGGRVWEEFGVKSPPVELWRV